MDQKDVKAVIATAFDEVMTEKLVPFIGKEVAASVQETVAKLRLQRQTFGKDMTGIEQEQAV